MLVHSPLKAHYQPHASHFNFRKVFFFLWRQNFLNKHKEQWKCGYVCDMIFAGALPPFSRTAVWEIPAAEAAEAAKAFNTQQTVI